MLQELSLEDERERKKTEPRAIVQRAPLQRRTEDLQLTKFVNTRQVITGAEAMAGNMAGAYYCKVCECALRDSQNYLAHINGRKHNRMLGMSMRAERSTLGEVRSRLEAHKAERDADDSLTSDEKAALYLEQFEERMRQREEEAKEEAAEKHRQQRAAARGEGSSSNLPAASSFTATFATGEGQDDEEDESEQQPDADAEAMAMMGFGGFGGSKKQG